MSYNRVNWKDYPDDSTPINADNLNVMDSGIKELDNKVTQHDQQIQAIQAKTTTDSLQLAERGGNYGTIKFGITPSGEYGYYKAGADSVTPFKKDQNFEITFDLKRTVKTVGGQAGDDKSATKSDTIAVTLSYSNGNLSISPSSMAQLYNSATTDTGRYGKSYVNTEINNLSIRTK